MISKEVKNSLNDKIIDLLIESGLEAESEQLSIILFVYSNLRKKIKANQD